MAGQAGAVTFTPSAEGLPVPMEPKEPVVQSREVPVDVHHLVKRTEELNKRLSEVETAVRTHVCGQRAVLLDLRDMRGACLARASDAAQHRSSLGDDLDLIFSEFHALLGLVDHYVEAMDPMDPMELRKCTRELRIGVKRLRLPNWGHQEH